MLPARSSHSFVFRAFGLVGAAFIGSLSHAGAAGVAISGVSQTSGIISTISITNPVGSVGETYNASSLFNGTSSGGDVTENSITVADDLDLESVAGRDDGAAAWQTLDFNGGNFQDTNGSGFDFFVFEANRNDDLIVRPVFTDNSVGTSVTIALANSVDWGSTGYTSSSFFNQEIFGVGFKITDLLDAGGVPLTNLSVIRGLEFNGAVSGRPDGADPAVIVAVIPEPTGVALASIALLFGLARRTRRA